jgi:hypothetical protein
MFAAPVLYSSIILWKLFEEVHQCFVQLNHVRYFERILGPQLLCSTLQTPDAVE